MHEVRRPPHAGTCTVYRPDIGGLLPVYVYDDYEGFEVRTFDRLDDAELEAYVRANADAVRDVAELADVEAGFANHVLMGPAILARGLGERPYAVKVHGSALEYTLKPHYKRFAPYASEGLVPAKAVLVGSRHTAESLWAAMPLEGLRERTFLGPPGVDVHTFVPRDKASATSELDALVRWLDSAERTGFGPAAAQALDALCHPRRDKPPDAEELAAVRAGYDVNGIDLAAPDGLAALDPEREPIVCYVGKLIVSKGVDLLLAAWPRVLAREPRAKLVVVGFGTYREGLEVLLRGLERADERLLMHVCRQGRALEGGPRDQLTYLRTFLEDIAGRHERYFAAAKKMRESIVFTGRLDHGELARLLPSAEEIIVPSMFPEAFGMVAAEGAACGVAADLRRPLGPGGGDLDPRREAAAPGAAAADVRAGHARGRGPRRVDERLVRPRRAATRRVAGGAGRHGVRAVRLGGRGRERRQRVARPDGGAGARAGRGAVLARGRARSPVGCSVQAVSACLPGDGRVY